MELTVVLDFLQIKIIFKKLLYLLRVKMHKSLDFLMYVKAVKLQ